MAPAERGRPAAGDGDERAEAGEGDAEGEGQVAWAGLRERADRVLPRLQRDQDASDRERGAADLVVAQAAAVGSR